MNKKADQKNLMVLISPVCSRRIVGFNVLKFLDKPLIELNQIWD